MIEQNAVFEIGNKKFFWEGSKIYNAETGEVVGSGNSDFIEVVYDTSNYATNTEYYLLFSRKDFQYEMGGCYIEGYIIRKDENTPGKIEVIVENLEYRYSFYGDISYCNGPFTFDGNYFSDYNYGDYQYNENYPGKDKNLKKYSTEFAEKIEPPKDNTPPKEETGSGTQEPSKDGTQYQTIKNEIKTENQFFKDVDLKNFDFKYQEITKNGQLYIVQDSTEYQNYIANKVNEFTLFSYVTVFFFVTFFSFNFIKNMLGK